MKIVYNIIYEVKLSFNRALVKSASAMADFKLSQLFGIPLKSSRVKITTEVKWSPPSTGLTKINVDGSSIGSPATRTIGFVTRDAQTNFLGAYAQNIGHAFALEAKLSSCMKAVEKARELHIENLWIERNSLQVVKAYNLGIGIPWRLLAGWSNCLTIGAQVSCKITHTFREGNLVADSLSKNGKHLALYSSQWWTAPPNFVLSLLLRDNIGLSFSRLYMD